MTSKADNTLLSDSDIDKCENDQVPPLPQRKFAPALIFADCDCDETMHCITIQLPQQRLEFYSTQDSGYTCFYSTYDSGYTC